jgi:putative transposase
MEPFIHKEPSMQIIQAYRYELKPNNVERTLLAKHAGTARFAWNWALARRIERFEHQEGKEKFTSAAQEHREWNVWKREHALWVYEVSKCAPQEAFRNLDKAFKGFWRGRKTGKPVGFPQFKKKGIHDSFRLTGSMKANGESVQLPRLGTIRVKEPTAVKGTILSATVSREADRWYVSFTVERERSDPLPVEEEIIGIDVGLICFAKLSNGEEIHAPKPLQQNLKRLKQRARKHSRKQKGSQNRRKSALSLARLHHRIKNQRTDFLHKVTTRLAKTKSVIVVEDLNVRGMVRNRHLARHITDVGWGQFRRMLEYKTQWYGSTLIVAPAFYPSSKRCNDCGHRMKSLPLSVREWVCPQCGVIHDRDLNAARNLMQFATASSAGSHACGDTSDGGTEHTLWSTSHVSLKQESNTVCPLVG